MTTGSFEHTKKQLGQKIKKLREAKGLSQDILAEKLNLSRTHISYIEIASATPSLKVLYDLSQVFGVDIQELFTP